MFSPRSLYGDNIIYIALQGSFSSFSCQILPKSKISKPLSLYVELDFFPLLICGPYFTRGSERRKKYHLKMTSDLNISSTTHDIATKCNSIRFNRNFYQFFIFSESCHGRARNTYARRFAKRSLRLRSVRIFSYASSGYK